ncbi:unnamed protein product [Allacma fusca]|uniref:Uncharacterized protein n=1 Tax=Allacma fusca TaxID=39272 RepID=A0A8J2NYG8_9HEXA|nr:unnamed protein product [Allacma fusca]
MERSKDDGKRLVHCLTPEKPHTALLLDHNIKAFLVFVPGPGTRHFHSRFIWVSRRSFLISIKYSIASIPSTVLAQYKHNQKWCPCNNEKYASWESAVLGAEKGQKCYNPKCKTRPPLLGIEIIGTTPVQERPEAICPFQMPCMRAAVVLSAFMGQHGTRLSPLRNRQLPLYSETPHPWTHP